MNAERVPKEYNVLLSTIADTTGQRGRAPPCVHVLLERKIRHAIAPVAWGKIRQHQGERYTKVNAPEQITLVAIVRKRYAAVNDFVTWKMFVPGRAFAMYETETAPITGVGGYGTLNSGVNITTQVPVSNLIPE